MSSWLPHLLFGLGGGLGAAARHGLTIVITHRFPVSTLVVNVAGCLALGLALGLHGGPGGGLGGGLGGALETDLRQLAFGFCGGFTTFSSFAYQTLDLHRSETVIHAAANILASLGACLLALWAGLALGPHLAG